MSVKSDSIHQPECGAGMTRQPRCGFWCSTAFAAPDRLVLVVLFLGAGAVLTRTHDSAVDHGVLLSASVARISNSFFHTSLLAQREKRV
jgi:hypothetical protein